MRTSNTPEGRGTTVYAPVPKPKDPSRDPHVARSEDSAAVGRWRERMGSAEAKHIYPQRAATAECVNAINAGAGCGSLWFEVCAR